VTIVQALQRALATEHAAVYGYGLVGAHLSSTELAAATAAYAAHQARRDAVAQLVRDQKAQPVAAPPAYRPRVPVTNRSTALRLAVRLEEDCAAAYIEILGATGVASLRRSAIGWATDAVVRDQSWRTALGPRTVALTPALPGLVVPTSTPTSSPTTRPSE
jgi:hypothetical protein